MAKKVEDLESVMGVLMSLIGGLIKAVKEVGGTVADIYRLVTPKGEATLREIARVIVRASGFLRLDRSRKFDSTKFEGLGKSWSIWRGLADGDGLTGEEDQDARSLALTEVDLSKVLFETCLKNGESSIKGEEKLKRLKELGHIRLDALIFQTLWENQDLIPESWKDKGFIFFDGTILRGPSGNRYVLYLCWGGGVWHWHHYWLDDARGSSRSSVVLASI